MAREYKEYKYECLKGLQPAEFFYWFGEIAAIPRGSGNEQGMIEFLKEYAEERHFPYEIDAKGNVFMRVPATPGYEDQPPVLFQAHVDIVAAVDEGVDFDFARDSLKLRREGDEIYACGTTLGADNGVGVATMLALADTLADAEADTPTDKTEKAHPPLELLFTVEEETGLHGIRQFDCSKIKARRMINMDCGDSHLLCVSTAGAIAGKIEKTYEMSPVGAGETFLEIRLFGGLGGHAGMVANKNRACAINNTGELIVSIFAAGEQARLCALASKGKAVCKEAWALLAVDKDKAAAIRQIMEKRFALIKGIYNEYDPDLSLTISEVDDKEAARALGSQNSEKESLRALGSQGSEKDGLRALDPQNSEKIGRLLSLIHTGQYRNDTVNFATVITSCSIQETWLKENGEFFLRYSVRSSSNPDKELLHEKFVFIAGMLGMELKEYDRYSGWPPRQHSDFAAKFSKAYAELFAEPLTVQRTHGCVETGVIVEQIPDMDAVGYAPTSTGAHTTSEHLFINEVAPYWEVIKKVMAQKE